MSEFYYFKKLGYEPFSKHRRISNATVAGTAEIKAAKTGGRLAITNLVISNNVADGSIAFYFGGKHNNDTPIAMFAISGSSHVNPCIQCLESTAVDSPLEAMVSYGATDAWDILIEGFELYDT